MDSTRDIKTDRRVVLLSVHPQYANAIMDGRKRVEFRKKFPEGVGLVVVYATKPVGKVVGWFTVQEIVEAPPASLWRQFSETGCIERGDFFDYFKGREVGLGVTVREVERLEAPVALKRLLPSGVPPQSFQYLAKSLLQKIQPTRNRLQFT